MSDGGIHISGVSGDVIGVGVSGHGNIIGKQVSLSGITLNAQDLARMPGEYAASLKQFSEVVNAQLAAHQVPPEKIAPVQEQLHALTAEVAEVKPGAPVAFTRKAGITSKLASMAKGLLKILPQTAETLAAFTPLAPFSKLIGSGVDEMIKSVQSETQP